MGGPRNIPPQISELKIREEVKNQPQTKRRKTIPEVLVNCKRIEDKVLEGEELDMEKFEIFDWDAAMEKHTAKLEMEFKVRMERIEMAQGKEKAWQLWKECKADLEENDKNWKVRRLERERDRERLERLHLAKAGDK